MVLHLKLFSVERGVLLVTLVSLLNCPFLRPFIRGYKKLEKTRKKWGDPLPPDDTCLCSV